MARTQRLQWIDIALLSPGHPLPRTVLNSRSGHLIRASFSLSSVQRGPTYISASPCRNSMNETLANTDRSCMESVPLRGSGWVRSFSPAIVVTGFAPTRCRAVVLTPCHCDAIFVTPLKQVGHLLRIGDLVTVSLNSQT